ncbi:MAG: L-rhamnose/proton symporter RhaT [Acutalibacteraceae bacterium]
MCPYQCATKRNCSWTYCGLFFHWLGGLASASFYIPYRRVRLWSWETYWLVGGFFSWIIAPFILASILVPDLIA